MRTRIFVAWYDFWVGAYYDRDAQTLYICPLPCVVIAVELFPRSRIGIVQSDGAIDVKQV